MSGLIGGKNRRVFWYGTESMMTFIENMFSFAYHRRFIGQFMIKIGIDSGKIHFMNVAF